MLNSQRFMGLNLLKDMRIPVPKLQVVESKDDISLLNLYSVEYGWTIRTCRTDGQMEMGLYYLNNATENTVVESLMSNFEEYQRKYAYIIYPSWSFIFSCNIIFSENNYVIEGANSSQKKISIGKSIPDFSVIIPFGMKSKMIEMIAKPSHEFKENLGVILSYCKAIPFESFYAECAYTSQKELIFYELFKLDTRNMHF